MWAIDLMEIDAPSIASERAVHHQDQAHEHNRHCRCEQYIQDAVRDKYAKQRIKYHKKQET